MSDVGIDYNALELPVMKGKNCQSFYGVLKFFPAEVSKIVKQPWNKMNGTESKGK